ncbi:E3 ubiquitin/ISG15 ligase TRIM25-like [Lampetra planeri]
MASAWSEEETFVCSVCLETLKDPATLPCGHSYCLVCIQKHWDKGNNKGQYSCPQCRQVFNPRPLLAKSTVLVEAMEKLRSNSLKQSSSTAGSSSPSSVPVYLEVLPDAGPQRGSMYPQLPTVTPRPCPQHSRPLDLFCRDDKECVCELCCQDGHQGHCVLKPEEERKVRQALVQALQQERLDVFSELVSIMNLTGNQVGELLGTHESSLRSQVEGQIHSLEQEVVQLHWKREELSRLANVQDHICFLKNFLTVEPLGPTGATEGSILRKDEAEVASIRSTLKELQESVTNMCKASLTNVAHIRSVSFSSSRLPSSAVFLKSASLSSSVVNGHTLASAPDVPSVTTVELVNPEPKTRGELLKFRFEPTMDPDTVYRHVQLSDGNHKATMKTESVNQTDHPERFHFWRQLLCKEPLAGSPYYWEVEWTGQKITVGVAYKEIERKSSDDKSRLGHNPSSWTVYWSGTGFSFWHNGQEKLLGSPKARRIGIYLDQHAGVLSFYRISNDQADLIHRHQTQFTGPLYPGFRFGAGVGATLTICQLDWI